MTASGRQPGGFEKNFVESKKKGGPDRTGRLSVLRGGRRRKEPESLYQSSME